MKKKLFGEPTHRLHTLMSLSLFRAVDREASSRGVTIRSLLESTLRDRYDPERANNDLLLLVREVRTLRQHIHRLEFGNKVTLEAIALTVKNLFSTLPPPTKEGRATGDAFYARFIEAVAKIVADDKSVLDTLITEVRFTPDDFAELHNSSPANTPLKNSPNYQEPL